MLSVPLLLGILVAPTWHWRVLILLVAACGFFLVRFPLALLVKSRKRKQPERGYYWRWTAIYGGITTLCGLWLVFGQALWWLLPMGLFGGGLLLFHLWLVALRQEMSVIGEMSGIIGLSMGATMAYYTASNLLNGTALALWFINVLYFGGTVFYIKLKVRQQPRQPPPPQASQRLLSAKACLVYQTIALTLVLLLVTLNLAPLLVPLAFVPATAKILHGAWQWQDKKSLSLMRLGITEMVHVTAFTLLVLLAFLA